MTSLDSHLLRVIGGLEESSWLPDVKHVRTTPLARGAYHTIVLIESAGVTTVARICRASQWGLTPERQLRREQLVLADLASTNVAPQPIHFIASDPPILIETYVKGSPFRYHDLDCFAESLARCHSVHPTRSREVLGRISSERTLLDDGVQRIKRIETEFPKSEAARLLGHFADTLAILPVIDWGRRCIVHTDLIHSNILDSKHGSRILDWEGARLAPPVWDLAYFLSPVTLRWAPADCETVTEERREQFVNAYAVAAGSDVEELRAGLRRLLPFVVFRALCWCAEADALPATGVEASAELHSFADASFIAKTLSDMAQLDSWI